MSEPSTTEELMKEQLNLANARIQAIQASLLESINSNLEIRTQNQLLANKQNVFADEISRKQTAIDALQTSVNNLTAERDSLQTQLTEQAQQLEALKRKSPSHTDISDGEIIAEPANDAVGDESDAPALHLA